MEFDGNDSEGPTTSKFVPLVSKKAAKRSGTSFTNNNSNQVKRKQDSSAYTIQNNQNSAKSFTQKASIDISEVVK